MISNLSFQDTYFSELIIERMTANEVQQLLNRSRLTAPQTTIDETVHVFTGIFDNGFEADVRFLKTGENYHIQSVLFTRDGEEYMILEERDEILGNYIFELDNYTYVLKVSA